MRASMESLVRLVERSNSNCDARLACMVPEKREGGMSQMWRPQPNCTCAMKLTTAKANVGIWAGSAIVLF